MEKEPKTRCSDCIHEVVCDATVDAIRRYREDAGLYPACCQFVEKNPVYLLKQNGRELLLIDIVTFLEPGKWFTVVRRTGETCNQITYTYPERFKVVGINFEPSEQKICVIVDEVS